MATAISEEARRLIVAAARRAGFTVVLKADGKDTYKKNLMFTAPDFTHPVFVRKEGAGIRQDGMPVYLQVAVHPDSFRDDVIDQAAGIEALINRVTGLNRFSSSNYRGFPYFEGNNEPCGMCYRIRDLQALETLLNRLRGGVSPKSKYGGPVRSTGDGAALADVEEGRRVPPRQAVSITTGLVIREPFITEVLEGRKTWEMRSMRTAKRGPIALIAKGSGQVRGVAKLVDVLPKQSEAQMLSNLDKHRIDVARLNSGETVKWRIPWVLRDALELPEPVPYRHPAGAVIWVALDDDIATAVSARIPSGWF